MENEKKLTFTETTRENPFILATIVLGMCLMVTIFYITINIDVLKEETFLEPEGLFNPQSFCDKLSGTPSWGNLSGDIIDTGFKDFGNNGSRVVQGFLIPNKIFFIYNPYCGWCQEQIKQFGDTWETYQTSGFTVNCAGEEEIK